MALSDISFKQAYRSDRDDLVSEFFIPCLSNCIQFDRSIQHVTVKSVSTLSAGFKNFAKNEAKIRMVTGHRFKPNELTLLSKIFYNEKTEKKPIEHNIENGNEVEILKQIIHNNKLEIKIAVPNQNEFSGYFSENMGIFRDSENNVVAFTGTSTETFTNQDRNFESLDVFTSWSDKSRVETKIADFENLWSNKTKYVNVCDFSYAERNNLLKYIV
ncbi:MAG TPA: DNA repair helicase [Nitrosopumilaceae archaeon]|nr:DNA repair helicase [Nitrosopumilaceae archaeon]